MPELPEVETVVRDLNKKVVGRRIVKVWFDNQKLIKDPLDQSRHKIAHSHVNVFAKTLTGEKIAEARRRGKNILIYLTHDKLLLIHQKMTGHMLVGKWKVKGTRVIPIEPEPVVDDPYNRFIHLILYLDNGKMLALSDLRKFAKAILGSVEQIENLPELTDLGPDALDPKLTYVLFAGRIRSHARKIKQVLLDQEVVAGIGNIYSDDILWTARVNPFVPAKNLSEKEMRAIYAAMKKILKIAVKMRGTSTSDFRDTGGKMGYYTNYRKVYQREGDPCPRRDGGVITRKKIGGRSAHFCPKCQVLK